MKARIVTISFVIAICLIGGTVWSLAMQGFGPFDLVPMPTPRPPVHIPFDPARRADASAEPALDIPHRPASNGRPTLTQPEGIDLDVTYINRAPMYQSYCVEYPEPWNGTVGIPRLCPGTEQEKRWPDQGEVVTWTAHIVNKGTVDSGPFVFQWLIDGDEVLSGTHPGLAPAAESTATYLWPWAHTMAGERVLDDHTVRFVVDPEGAIAETYEGNNSLEDRTNALSLRITLTPEMYAAYNVPVTSTLPFSAEDWLQKQVAAMNQALANSIYPVTPQGATERVRLNAILVAAKPPDDGRAHDGTWFLEADVRDPDISYYTYEQDIDWGLIHELSHQIGLIDLYASMIDAYSVRVLDREGFPANLSFEWPRGGLMFGGDTAPHNNPHLYSSHSAGGISSTKGYRNNYYGAYQYDIPEQNYLLVLDNQGNPASDVQVALYQRSGPFDWLGLPEIDNTAEISGTTGIDGRMALANRDAHGGTVTRVGQSLRDNPFGPVDIVGVQNRFLLKLSAGEHVEFHWLDITSFNLAYWMGDTISHTFTITSHVPSSAAPAAPQMLTGRVSGFHATLSWGPSPSPGVVGYRVYRATPPDYDYVLASDLLAGTSFEEYMTDGSTWLGHCVYAITAVDAGGLESEFSNLVYVPSQHPVRDVAVSSDGTRTVLDPWNRYPLFRQQYDGRYTHRLAIAAYDLFDARFLTTDRADRLLVSAHEVRVFDRDAVPLFKFGGIGSGPGEFDVPTGIATWEGPCAAGGPYELDEQTSLLLHFDQSYRGAHGESGTANGTSFVQGRYGSGVLIDGNDTLTYATARNLDRAAGTIDFWVRPNRDDDLGQIHALFEFDYMDNGIQIVKHGGGNLHFLMWTPTNLTDIHAQTEDWRAGEWHHVAAAWQGNHMALIVDGLLQAYSGTASPTEALPDVFYVGSSPRGDWQADAVIDELRISEIPRPGDSGVCSRILVADSGNYRLQAFDALGNTISSYGSYGSGPGQFNDPQGLAVDPRGRVIVADTKNDRLQVLHFDGTTFSSPAIISGGLSSPTDVAAASVGRIVVADTGNSAIKVFDAAGTLQATYTGPNDGCSGSFSEPHGVAVDAEGTIIVADSNNERVVTIRGALPRYRIWLPLASRK
jgi:hypothetical protein